MRHRMHVSTDAPVWCSSQLHGLLSSGIPKQVSRTCFGCSGSGSGLEVMPCCTHSGQNQSPCHGAQRQGGEGARQSVSLMQAATSEETLALGQLESTLPPRTRHARARCRCTRRQLRAASCWCASAPPARGPHRRDLLQVHALGVERAVAAVAAQQLAALRHSRGRHGVRAGTGVPPGGQCWGGCFVQHCTHATPPACSGLRLCACSGRIGGRP